MIISHTDVEIAHDIVYILERLKAISVKVYSEVSEDLSWLEEQL